jgi:3'(2'), 5'-bisphosphate nucleotidase
MASIISNSPESLLLPTILAALKAGSEILKIYDTDFGVEYKDDSSPLTQADKNAHQAIATLLAPFGIPLLSEEGSDIAYSERKGFPLLWIVDPLDGTKEFVKKNGEFTVNIALIRVHYPVMGIIFQPTENLLYFGCEGIGSYKLEGAREKISPGDTLIGILGKAKQLPFTLTHTGFKVACSRSHLNTATSAYVAKLKKIQPDVTFLQAGSSLKFCLVAEGTADIYPRFGPTMEWDTAAGQAIVEYAAGSVTDCSTQNRLSYNREELRNASFLVKGKGMRDQLLP